jgi:hypothetical protein
MLFVASICSVGCQGPAADLPRSSVVVRPVLKDPPEWMTADCPEPPPLAERDMQQVDTEKEWSADLKLLAECRSKHGALRSYYKSRDAKLRAAR